ncbi:MAG TPA: hypothetical protein VN426_09150 [Syntrophomonadaceae bacterium]|nr:hypothetical protein [Syntrophomonadaceae bacterium]
MNKRLFLCMSVMLLFVIFLAAQVIPASVTADTLPDDYSYGYDSIETPTTVNLNVTIQVNGGTNSPADCTVHVVDSLSNPVSGSPATGSSSYTFSLIPGSYTVSQDSLTGYDTMIDGSPGYSESITLTSDGDSVLIVNNAIVIPPNPHITVAKTGNTASLPYGGGSVTYTYTVTNDGNVPLYIDSIVDDTIPTFGSSNYVSGDNSNPGILDPNESWVYTATAAISATVKNTVTVNSSYLSSESSATHEPITTDRTPLEPVSASFIVTVAPPPVTESGGGGDGLNVGTPETVSVPETPQVTTPQVPETPKVTTPQVPPTVVTPEPVVVPVVTPKMPNTGVDPVYPVVGWPVVAGICLAVLFIVMAAKRKGMFSSCK